MSGYRLHPLGEHVVIRRGKQFFAGYEAKTVGAVRVFVSRFGAPEHAVTFGTQWQAERVLRWLEKRAR